MSKGRVNKAVILGDDYPALLRARRRRERWSEEDKQLYQRHRWRSEGYHGEAKNWHGLARAVRRGLGNMKIQAYLTAAAVNLKRLAAALLAHFLGLVMLILPWNPSTSSETAYRQF
ncbi:hypothetical protein X772_35570 [Mesorhizobium sp. LSJC280B00]|nr:hypothetical protein X772_35570 [Mesorhizobium sp. LSJC280B00]